MVAKEGLPVGYDVFPGNMYEGDTFKTAIDKIKVRYLVKRVVIVADSGMLSKQNIEFLEKEKLDYILALYQSFSWFIIRKISLKKKR